MEEVKGVKTFTENQKVGGCILAEIEITMEIQSNNLCYPSGNPRGTGYRRFESDGVDI